MLAIERQDKIMEILKANKTAVISDLAKSLFIGEATIRRDMDKLQKQNLIKRTYGGAVLIEGLDSEIPLYVRENEQADAKEIIGRKAAELVNDGDILILDSSSTTYSMIKFLKSKENLTIITNGMKTAISLGEYLHTKIYCTGGKLRENSLSLVGNQAKSFIKNYMADTLFFSCRAILRNNGMLDASDDEAELRKEMITICKKIVLLCDSSKFDKTAFYKICGFDKIDYIITDKKPDSEWLTFFSQHNIALLY